MRIGLNRGTQINYQVVSADLEDKAPLQLHTQKARRKRNKELENTLMEIRNEARNIKQNQ